LLADDPAYAERAQQWDHKLRDVQEWLVEAGCRAPTQSPFDRPTTVTYHESCHLVHGQKVSRQPRALLKLLPGVTLTELPESSWCCGSAGIYALTQPDQADALLKRKVGHIATTGAQIVATANPGCHLQIARGLRDAATRVQVVHPVSFTAGDAVLEQGALLFSAAPGSVDGAMFTGTGQGFTGDGEFATLHFQVVTAGDPKIAFAGTDARDNQNHTVILATGVTAVTPKSFVTAFAPAMPNPFGRSTTFAFSLATAGRADLEVFSVDGRRVRTITSGLRDAGEYRLEWNGADDSGHRIAPGVYYARLVTAQGRFTRVVTRLE